MKNPSPIPLAELLPARTDRACFIGQTGSGKTTLARYVLAQRPKASVLIYDAKGELNWPGYKRFTSLRSLVNKNPLRAIYAPSLNEIDDEKFWDGFFSFAYHRKNTTVYVDEVYSITTRQELPRHYKACLTRGRSRGVEIYSATQRPKDIPAFILSESEHLYVFFLKLPQDKKRVEEMTGLMAEQISRLKKKQNEFFYLDDERIRGPLKLDLNRRG